MNSPTLSTRTRVEIDGREFLLDGDHDLVDLMTRIETAARSEPMFVDLSGGERLVSVLISSRSSVVVSVVHEGVARPTDEAPVAPLADWDL